MRVLPGRDFAVLERDGKPVLLLHGKEEERAELQDKLREVMSELPRGQQISGFTFRDSPLPRTATGKIQRWELTGKQPQ
jgi:acyl-coenzyme A synthetase/AMP-(fatty) acid ligase